MARYKVDKKKFEEKLLEEQLKQIELQGKYLRDEPLRRSEVDEYNKLQTSSWVKNTLITIGVLAATAIAFVIFILLGNMLITNGRSGNVGKENIDSSQLYETFKNSEHFPQIPKDSEGNFVISSRLKIEYKVPKEFLLDPSHDVYVDYTLEWRPDYDQGTGQPLYGKGQWMPGTDKDGTIGQFTQSNSVGKNNDLYALDVKTVNLNELMTDWFKGQEDGLAKNLIERWFYSAWPLTVILWMVYLGSIAGYLVILVVGIRFVIKTFISILRKAGYIASDFVVEVVSTVKSELPIVETDPVKDISADDLRKRIEERRMQLADSSDSPIVEETKVEPEKEIRAVSSRKDKEEIRQEVANNEVEEKPKLSTLEEESSVLIRDEPKEPVIPIEEETKVEEKKTEDKKRVEDKFKDIFEI